MGTLRRSRALRRRQWRHRCRAHHPLRQCGVSSVRSMHGCWCRQPGAHASSHHCGAPPFCWHQPLGPGLGKAPPGVARGLARSAWGPRAPSTVVPRSRFLRLVWRRRRLQPLRVAEFRARGAVRPRWALMQAKTTRAGQLIIHILDYALDDTNNTSGQWSSGMIFA